MKVRIAIAESNRIVELEVDDVAEFEASMESAFSGDSELVWVEDSKKRRVGIPRSRISYVEIELTSEKASVGFASSS
ncbi:MAG TPA: DUF3107 family protein [Acidimicrobiia bacterium]